MKAIVCELCGSNDIVKQDGFFVCQHCGTKYSIEEAKKLLGTVKIDRSEEFEKYMELAETCSKNADHVNAEKYFEKALEIKPSSSRAYLEMTLQHCDVLFTTTNDWDSLEHIAFTLYSSFDTCLELVIKEHNIWPREREEAISSIVRAYTGKPYICLQVLDEYCQEQIDKSTLTEKKNIVKWAANYISEFIDLYNFYLDSLRNSFGNDCPSVEICKNAFSKFMEIGNKYVFAVNEFKLPESAPKKEKRNLFNLFRKG